MKQIVKNIFSILDRREKRKLGTLMILDLFISILDILFLIGLLYVISFYTDTRQSTEPLFSLTVLKKYPLLLIIVFFLLFGMKNLFGFLVFKMQYNFVYGVASRISKDKLMQYLNGPYNSYVNIDSSVNIRKISQQPIEFCHYVLHGMQMVFGQFILIIITVIVILIYDPVLFLLLLLILLPPVFLAAFFMKRKLRAVRLHSKTTGERSLQHLQEALAGFVESNIHKQNEFFTSRYHRFQSKLNLYLAENQVIQNMPSRLIEVFAVFGLFMLLLLNSLTENNISIQLVTIGAFMAAAYKIIPGIVKIMNNWGQVKTYSFTIADLLNSEDKSIKIAGNDMPVSSIEFKNVDFSYPGKKVLESFHLKAVKGDLVGISGSSGKGKTTIGNLLLGFLTPASGNILINDEMSNNEERQAYWARVAYIKQQPFFLHDTVLQNITLQESGNDEQKLSKVMAATGVDELIGSAADGSSAIITENGKNFSGGQRQRIIFARALYKDADLLILDEPFNELDESSETAMLELLKKIAAEGKIILLITHNKHALSFCNKQILMDER